MTLRLTFVTRNLILCRIPAILGACKENHLAQRRASAAILGEFVLLLTVTKRKNASARKFRACPSVTSPGGALPPSMCSLLRCLCFLTVTSWGISFQIRNTQPLSGKSVATCGSRNAWRILSSTMVRPRVDACMQWLTERLFTCCAEPPPPGAITKLRN